MTSELKKYCTLLALDLKLISSAFLLLFDSENWGAEIIIRLNESNLLSK